jgi:undecaprenyl-diphosphatase
VLLPILYGAAALRPAIVMACTGVLGLTVYTLLKRVCVRERPFITHAAIDLKAVPLDRYSFPSGHTLHAVSFAWQATAHFPELGWVLVPLAALIAASRMVLGLHYPSDMLAGAAIGAALAELGTSLA